MEMFSASERLFADITFDMNACVGALDCGKCMQACSPHVLRTYTAVQEGKAQTSKDWIPTATFPSICTGCMKCVEACPHAAKGAIKVELKPMRLPNKWYKRG